MAEYIDRDLFLKNVKHNAPFIYSIVAPIALITPPEDVAPVRHGKWENMQETDMYVPEMKFTITKTAETCSVCKSRVGFVGAKQYLFDSICPNCGAKMEGVDTNDER